MNKPSDILQNMLGRYEELKTCEAEICRAFEILRDCYKSGGKLLVCGNGGSAADAEHITGELLKSFCLPREVEPEKFPPLSKKLAENLQLGLPAIPLTSFVALSTAYQNDLDGVYTYAQLAFALGAEGDVILGISTSGNAKNVNYAFEAAKAKGMQCIALTGQGGGAMSESSDCAICVPDTETHRIQELHLPVYHTLCLMLEAEFFGSAE